MATNKKATTAQQPQFEIQTDVWQVALALIDPNPYQIEGRDDIDSLKELADKLQLVILTCHPERYGGLKMTEFDLELLEFAVEHPAGELSVLP